MTIRIPVSALENSWHDAQRVVQEDMQTEQDANNQNIAAVVNNISGSGVLPRSQIQNVLFDSNFLDSDAATVLSLGNFDGTGINVTKQPTDINLGNQIEVELTGSSVYGRLSTKVLIIGLDFQGNLQYDRFVFRKNEKQVTSKHYIEILSVFFNDFKGNNNCSRDLGGRIVIKEAASFELSRDPIMIAQDVEPNLFFRDWKVPSLTIGPNVTVALYKYLQQGIGSEYSVDALNIRTTAKQYRKLPPNDEFSKIGQKFKAKTNNIQKITILLGAVANTTAPVENMFDWAGSLTFSIYPIQTTVNCPTDIVPGLAIDFDPSNNPIAQITLNQADFKSQGIVLNDVPQPVDFVFTNSQISSATNNLIKPGNYYALTVNRSGSANAGTLFVATGNNNTDNSRLTLFNGVWVDVPEEDLWYQVWTDAAKLADGQAYDAGNGIEISKTTIDSQTGSVIDYQVNNLSFVNAAEKVLNTGLVQAIQKESVQIQDERTGNPIYSRQQYEPVFSFVTNSDLVKLQSTSEPLLVGSSFDINPKSNSIFNGIQKFPGLALDNSFCIVAPSDGIVSMNLIGSKIIPDIDCSGYEYRIFKSTLCTDGYGDVNGDGYIDQFDIARCSDLIGESLNYSSTQAKINSGLISTLELLRADVDGDGYITYNDLNLLTKFVNKEITSFPVGGIFTHLCLTVEQSVGRWDGYYDCSDGYVRVNGSASPSVPSSSLDPYELIYDGYLKTPSISGDNPEWLKTPYVPMTYQIQPQPFWQDYFLVVNTDARQMPASFTYPDKVPQSLCSIQDNSLCLDTTNQTPNLNTGRNDIMVPDNFIIGRGQILRPDNTFYKVDFEVASVVLEMPATMIDGYSINLFEKFVADQGNGVTVVGYEAMRFADCTTVKLDALAKNQVRWAVSIQSYYPNLDGYTVEDGYGIIVDDIIGVYLDYSTGILTLSLKDLDINPIYLTAVTRLQVTVYLKKAGFNNRNLVIPSEQLYNLLSK